MEPFMAVRHLYVHVPFCRSRCAYCDFASEPVGPHRRARRVELYLAALRAELAVNRSLLATPLETVYLGGGTPTVLPREDLLALVGELAGLLTPPAGQPCALPSPASGAPEFTVEANPGTIDVALLAGLEEAGATRLSLGIQSFSPGLRAALGRAVTQEEITESLEALRLAGWVEWNLDLVFGIPGQTWADVQADLSAALAAAPPHVSLYDLTYTARYSRRLLTRRGARKHAVPVPGAQEEPHEPALAAAAPGAESSARAAAEAFAEERYAQAVGMLVDAGYERYEVSNFALPGHECRHNQAYWLGEDYLGLGASAVSTVAGVRRTNPTTVAGYLGGAAPELEDIDERKRLFEKAMLGLRTSRGVDEREVGSVLDAAALERLLRQGCVERRYGRIRLNPGFVDVGNSIIAALLEPPEGP